MSNVRNNTSAGVHVFDQGLVSICCTDTYQERELSSKTVAGMGEREESERGWMAERASERAEEMSSLTFISHVGGADFKMSAS